MPGFLHREITRGLKSQEWWADECPWVFKLYIRYCLAFGPKNVEGEYAITHRMVCRLKEAFDRHYGGRVSLATPSPHIYNVERMRKKEYMVGSNRAGGYRRQFWDFVYQQERVEERGCPLLYADAGGWKQP